MAMGFNFYLIGAYLDCSGCEHCHGYDCVNDCCFKCESRQFSLTVNPDGSFDINATCLFDPLGCRPGKVCEHYLETGWR